MSLLFLQCIFFIYGTRGELSLPRAALVIIFFFGQCSSFNLNFLINIFNEMCRNEYRRFLELIIIYSADT